MVAERPRLRLLRLRDAVMPEIPLYLRDAVKPEIPLKVSWLECRRSFAAAAGFNENVAPNSRRPPAAAGIAECRRPTP